MSPTEAHQASLHKHALCLVGKFAGRRPSIEAVERFVVATWRTKLPVLVGLGPNGCFRFGFQHFNDLVEVLQAVPWSLSDNVLRLKRWDAKFDPNEDFPTLVPIWVRLRNISFELFSPDLLFTIGKAIGKPLRIDEFTLTLKRLTYARICIELNPAMDLPQHIEVITSEGILQILVEYENLPSPCTSCNQMGHPTWSCPHRTKKDKGKGPMIDHQQPPQKAGATPSEDPLAPSTFHQTPFRPAVMVNATPSVTRGPAITTLDGRSDPTPLHTVPHGPTIPTSSSPHDAPKVSFAEGVAALGPTITGPRLHALQSSPCSSTPRPTTTPPPWGPIRSPLPLAPKPLGPMDSPAHTGHPSLHLAHPPPSMPTPTGHSPSVWPTSPHQNPFYRPPPTSPPSITLPSPEPGNPSRPPPTLPPLDMATFPDSILASIAPILDNPHANAPISSDAPPPHDDWETLIPPSAMPHPPPRTSILGPHPSDIPALIPAPTPTNPPFPCLTSLSVPISSDSDSSLVAAKTSLDTTISSGAESLDHTLGSLDPNSKSGARNPITATPSPGDSSEAALQATGLSSFDPNTSSGAITRGETKTSLDFNSSSRDDTQLAQTNPTPSTSDSSSSKDPTFSIVPYRKSARQGTKQARKQAPLPTGEGVTTRRRAGQHP
ncbi:hypothetical protein QJS10_CPB21g01737 [Acorus calamus]|uniref:DUF4283 domain-containing protein n=1 Tax=Acorus calamus TaxID=4465 RepID=A0AAV9C7E6_ACOCL|nr:hypothetical protein QJS10_CPB21g01737 [Acorus calamus]